MTGTWRRRLVGLQALEHLVAVHLRHHDVEQHEVERLRAASSSSASRPLVAVVDVRVALALQALRERVAVVLVVVDDEQRGIGDAIARPRSRQQRLDLRAQARKIDRLGVVVVAARRRAPSRGRPVIACAESAMHRNVPRRLASALSRRVASQPSSTGRLRSMRMRSGCSARAMATPCSPSPRDQDRVAARASRFFST